MDAIARVTFGIAVALAVFACGPPQAAPPPVVSVPTCVPCSAPPPTVVASPSHVDEPKPVSLPELTRLAKARIAAAEQGVERVRAMYMTGRTPASEFLQQVRLVFVAARDSGIRGDDLVRLAQRHRDAMAQALDLTQQRYQAGTSTVLDVDLAKYYVAEADYWLEEAKTK